MVPGDAELEKEAMTGSGRGRLVFRRCDRRRICCLSIALFCVAPLAAPSSAVVVTIDFEPEEDLSTALVDGHDLPTPPNFGVLCSFSDADAGRCRGPNDNNHTLP